MINFKLPTTSNKIEKEYEKYNETIKEYQNSNKVMPYSIVSQFIDTVGELKTKYIQQLAEHFKLETSDRFATDYYTFCLWTEVLIGNEYHHICIKNIADISQAFYLIKKLQSNHIDVTLCYTIPANNWQKHYSYLERFGSLKAFNYHARYVLRCWHIKEENNIKKLDAEMDIFQDEKK